MVKDVFDREIKLSDYVVISGKSGYRSGRNNMRVGIVTNVTEKGTVVCHIPHTNRTYNSLESKNVCIIDKDLALSRYPELEKYEQKN